MRLIRNFFESLYYDPKWYHWIVALLLAPLSLVYSMMMRIRRALSKQTDYGVPIVSIGNLLVGGSGKTPFAVALAEQYSHMKVTIISRGYGRQSKGLVEVSRDGEVLVDVASSGDEARLMANLSSNASVIVSEDRGAAVRLAIKQGAQLILLDDGFNRVEIVKFDILLEPNQVPNSLPLPSGPFREFSTASNKSDLHLKEGRDFHRVVTYENLTECMVLATSIANPSRLDKYLPNGVVHRLYLEDHAYFDRAKLQRLLKEYNASSLLVTQKDLVKMEDFGLQISMLALKLEIDKEVLEKIDNYIDGFDAQ